MAQQQRQQQQQQQQQMNGATPEAAPNGTHGKLLRVPHLTTFNPHNV
jgi:ATP-dependent helicase STH1/SNF2